MLNSISKVLAAALCIMGGAVCAQDAPAPGTVAAASVRLAPGQFDPILAPHAPLSFDAETKSLGAFSSLGNSVFKPEGGGPFPAVLVVHSCGGVGTPALRERAKEFLAAGYLILMLDSFQPRNQRDCRNGVITSPVVWRDGLDALAHLQSLSAVDKGRIYLVGFSLGSIAAAALASPSLREAFGSARRFRATVGWYGSCGYPPTQPGGRPSHFLRGDTDTPTLLLMADGDRETPIRPYCFPLLDDLKASARPVEWHVYGAPTTHAWDVRSGYTMTTRWGDVVVNTFDADATADAMKRTLEFLNRHR